MTDKVRSVPKPQHKRRVPKRGDRSKFSKFVRDQVKDHFNNTCQMCLGKGVHLHHVKFRSQGGRGVFSNALLVCNSCHKEIHQSNDLAKYWREVYKKKHGPTYFMDDEDIRLKQLTDSLSREVREDDEALHS